jgi:hypothetical protein
MSGGESGVTTSEVISDRVMEHGSLRVTYDSKDDKMGSMSLERKNDKIKTWTPRERPR